MSKGTKAGAKTPASQHVRRPIEWVSEAPHIGALLANTSAPLKIVLAVIAETRDRLIAYLESVEPESPVETRSSGIQERFIHPPGHPERPDLRDLHFGERYCAHFERIHTGRSLAALKLLRRCLLILQRGDLMPQDRAVFMAEYLALGGVEAEVRQEAARQPRSPRSKPELHGHLASVWRQHPGETLDQLLQRLQGDRIVIAWDAETLPNAKIRWKGPDGEKETPRGTVKGWHTSMNKLR